MDDLALIDFMAQTEEYDRYLLQQEATALLDWLDSTDIGTSPSPVAPWDPSPYDPSGDGPGKGGPYGPFGGSNPGAAHENSGDDPSGDGADAGDGESSSGPSDGAAAAVAALGDAIEDAKNFDVVRHADGTYSIYFEAGGEEWVAETDANGTLKSQANQDLGSVAEFTAATSRASDPTETRVALSSSKSPSAAASSNTGSSPSSTESTGGSPGTRPTGTGADSMSSATEQPSAAGGAKRRDEGGSTGDGSAGGPGFGFGDEIDSGQSPLVTGPNGQLARSIGSSALLPGRKPRPHRQTPDVGDENVVDQTLVHAWRWGDFYTNRAADWLDKGDDWENGTDLTRLGDTTIGIVEAAVGDTLRFGEDTYLSTGPGLEEAGTVRKWVEHNGELGLAQDFIRGLGIGASASSIGDDFVEDLGGHPRGKSGAPSVLDGTSGTSAPLGGDSVEADSPELVGNSGNGDRPGAAGAQDGGDPESLGAAARRRGKPRAGRKSGGFDEEPPQRFNNEDSLPPERTEQFEREFGERNDPERPKNPGNRGRFRTTEDAQRQLEEIEDAQRKVRKGKSDSIIDSTAKSEQRLNNDLKRVDNKADALREYTEGSDSRSGPPDSETNSEDTDGKE